MNHTLMINNRGRGLAPGLVLAAAAIAAGGWPGISGASPLGAKPVTVDGYTLEAGHESLQEWQLPDRPPHPEGNAPTAARVELGKHLFFDPRLSGDGTMSCASCHNPALGWSDGLPTARGFRARKLGRATPTIVNSGFNALQMWDGRKNSLEDQAMGPMRASAEMNTEVEDMLEWLRAAEPYRALFAAAYPGEPIDEETVSKAIASFERTVVSNDSPFDRWVRGDADAMTGQQVRGLAVFLDPARGNCSVCHSAPNFTDDGFHNLGLASFGVAEPDPGRYAEVPLGLMKGAFKTPTLRNVTQTAPYFHDGSARTLRAVVEHYAAGGEVTTNLSPNMKALDLTPRDKRDLVAFLRALTSPQPRLALPELPVTDPPTRAADPVADGDDAGGTDSARQAPVADPADVQAMVASH